MIFWFNQRCLKPNVHLNIVSLICESGLKQVLQYSIHSILCTIKIVEIKIVSSFNCIDLKYKINIFDIYQQNMRNSRFLAFRVLCLF